VNSPNNNIDSSQSNELEIVDLDAERIRIKRTPWKNHRAIKESDLIRTTTPEKVLEIVKNKLPGIRERTLFLILYICAARIEEIVKYKYIKWGNKKVRAISINSRPKIITRQDYKKKIVGEVEYGICKQNIAEEIFNGKEVIVFSIRNLKNKKEHRKRIPFVLNKPVYIEMWSIMKTYLSGLTDEDPLFNFGARRAEKLLEPTGWNPHSLRALRLTHLVRFHNFADQKLRVFSGWSDTRPAREYIQLGWEELVDSM
jgi:hypothetical protein